MSDNREVAKYNFTFKRLWHMMFLLIQSWPIWPGRIRCVFLRLGGINVLSPTFIGSNVSFDTLKPEYITIGKNTVITSGTKILTHFYAPNDDHFYLGKVKIGNGVFIGLNTLIVNSVVIGDNAVLGAGSVVTKDIPSGEVWAGVPAKFIKKVKSL